MSNYKSAFIGSMCLFLCALFLSTPVNAISNDAEAANKAGRQRMLSQRIALSYFMIGTNTEAAVATQRTDASIAEFHSNLMELRDYTKDPATLALLDKESTLWGDYSMLAMSKPNLTQGLKVLLLSDQVLAACNDVVAKITTKATSGIPRLVDTAGRQRMISQRLGKYYFAMMWKVGDPSLEGNFLKVMQEFDTNMNILLQSPENTPAINNALKRVNADWGLSKAVFKQYKDGRFAPSIIAATTESILKSMNDITGMYLALAAVKK